MKCSSVQGFRIPVAAMRPALSCTRCCRVRCFRRSATGREARTWSGSGGPLRRFLRLQHGGPRPEAFFGPVHRAGPQRRAEGAGGGCWRTGRRGWTERLSPLPASRGSVPRRCRRARRGIWCRLSPPGARVGRGQVQGDAKSTEIAVLPKRGALRALPRRSGTADALPLQRAPAEAVPAWGGASGRALTGNQGRLDEDVRLYLADPAQAGKRPSCERGAVDHGRIKPRHGLPRACLAARAAGLAGADRLRQERGPARDRKEHDTRNPLLHPKRAAAARALPAGRAHPRAPRRQPALGARRDHERGSPAKPQPPRARQPRPAAASPSTRTPRPPRHSARTTQARRLERRLPPHLDPSRCMTAPKATALF